MEMVKDPLQTVLRHLRNTIGAMMRIYVFSSKYNYHIKILNTISTYL